MTNILIIDNLLSKSTGFFSEFQDSLYEAFIVDDRYQLFVKGIGNTILISICACILGLILGVLIAYSRILPQDKWYCRVLANISKVFVTVVRGTPVVVQLLIMYTIILASIKYVADGIVVGIITFGLNSAAYVSEILRGGVLAVDKGQYEAGRSLGFSWQQTNTKIIMPQAIKNSTPSIFNELITLVKETSVIGYVGILDLTKAGNNLISQTADVVIPLATVAITYLIIVLMLEWVQRKIERRLAKGDKS